MAICVVAALPGTSASAAPPDAGARRILFTRDADGPAGTTGYCYLAAGQPYCGTGGPAPPWIFIMNADGSHAVRIGEGRQGTFAPNS